MTALLMKCAKNTLDNNIMKIKDSLAVYAYYDPEGEWTDEASFYINYLSQIFEEIIIVSNSKLVNFPLKNKRNISLMERENKGFDFGAWKDAILSRGENFLLNLDYLCLCNSSVFGPIGDLSHTFKYAEQKNWSFWGLTEHPKAAGVDYHIQSYFMVFRKGLLQRREFFRFWKEMEYSKTWKDTVQRHEIPMTKAMLNMGAKVGAVFTFPELSKKEPNPLLLYAPETIQAGLPFLKKKVFTEPYDYFFSRGDGKEALFSYELIKKTNPLLANLILDYLSHKVRPSRLREGLHNTVILPTQYPTSFPRSPLPLKAGVVFYVFYEDLFDYSSLILSQLDINLEICIVSSKPHLLQRYKNKFQKDSRFIFRAMENRGRNEAAFFVICKDLIQNWDVTCFLHDKKTGHGPHPHVGETWMKFCISNLFASNSFILNVITLFSKNPKLGMLLPPPPLFGPLSSSILQNPWGRNRQQATRLINALKLKNFLDDDPVAPFGGMFWLRKEAISNFLELDLHQQDYPPEPVEDDGTFLHALERMYAQIVQSNEYLSQWVLAIDYAPVYIDNLYFLLKKKSRPLENLRHLFVANIRKILINNPRLYELAKRLYRALTSN